MADQLTFALIAQYKDQASAGLTATKGTLAEFRAEVLKLAADEAKLKFGRATDVIRFGEAWGTAGGQLQRAGAQSTEAQRALQSLAQHGLGPLASEIPGVNSAFAKLVNNLSGFPLLVGAMVGAGVGVITLLKGWQDQATKTLSTVTAMAQGIATEFRATQAEIARIRAEAIGDAATAAQKQFEAVAERAEGEKTQKIKAAQDAAAELIRINQFLNTALLAQTGINLDALIDVATGRTSTEAKLAADRATAESDANNKILIGKANLAAAEAALDKARQQATLAIAAGRIDAELQVRGIEAKASQDRLAAIDVELQRALAAAEAKRKAALVALGPSVAASDPRAQQAELAAVNEVKIAEANAAAARKTYAQDLAKEKVALAQAGATQEIQLAAALEAQALQSNAAIAAAVSARQAVEAQARGDQAGVAQANADAAIQAAQTELAGVTQAKQAQLAGVIQAQQAELANYITTQEARFGKTAETDALIAAKSAQTNQAIQAATQSSQDAIAAKEQETAEKRAAIEAQLAAQLESIQEARIATHAEQLSRIATAEQQTADAQGRARDAAISGEAEVRAARLKAAGDAKGAEEVLGRARLDALERALQTELTRHQTVIANLERELSVQERIAANTSNDEKRVEAQTKVKELTEAIKAEEAAIAETRAKSTAEIEKQKIAMEGVAEAAKQVESSSKRTEEAQKRATDEANRAAEANRARVSALNAAFAAFTRTVSDLKHQLSQVGEGASFAFVQDPKLRSQIEQLRERIVQATGAQRIALVKELEALLAKNQEQLDADRKAAEIQAEWRALDERRNQLLEQIKAEQEKLRAAINAFIQSAHKAAEDSSKKKPSAQRGGIVQGSPGQPVDITAHAGELVVPADIVRHMVRKGGAGGRRFQGGGIVSGGAVVGGDTTTIIVNGGNASAGEIAREIERRIRDRKRRRGGAAA
jgi:hypothetical protein